MIDGIRNFPYERRLELLNLHSLERRRARGDLVELFMWLRDFNTGDVHKILILSDHGRTRNNGLNWRNGDLTQRQEKTGLQIG